MSSGIQHCPMEENSMKKKETPPLPDGGAKDSATDAARQQYGAVAGSGQAPTMRYLASYVVRFEFIRACNHLVAYLDTQKLEDFEIRTAAGKDVPHDISYDIEIVRTGGAAALDPEEFKAIHAEAVRAGEALLED